MEIANQAEELADLLGYVLSQSNLPRLSELYPYLLVLFGFLGVLYFLYKLVMRNRKVDDYMIDTVSIALKFPPMGETKKKINDIVRLIHKEIIDLYGPRKHFSIDVVIRKGHYEVIVNMPGKVFKMIATKLSDIVDYQNITKERDATLEKVNKQVVGIELELSKDFAYPLLYDEESTKTKLDLKEGEFLLFQICLRPIEKGWQRTIDSLIENLKNGRDPNWNAGCFCSGCVAPLLPIFDFFANLGTKVMHGSSPDIERKNSELSGKFDKEIEVLKKKYNKYAFETEIKIICKGKDSDSSYKHLDDVIDLLAEKVQGNSFIVSKLHKRVRTGFKNDLILSFLSRKTADVVNLNEVVDILNRVVGGVS